MSDLSTIFHGSGGGGGCRDDTSCEYTRGRNGGGIIFLAARELNLGGSLSSDGENADGGQAGTCDDTIGGAGAGGSIYVISETATLSASTLRANGGSSTYISQSGVTTGTGGDGRIRFDFATLNGYANGSTEAESELSGVASPTVGHSEIP